MNHCTFLGRLTRDVELRSTANGKSVGNFSLAINKNGGREGVDFLDFVVWEKRAEAMSKYLEKGNLVLIEADANVESWEKDGQKRSKVVFNVQNFHFVGGNGKSKDTEDDVKRPVEDSKAVPVTDSNEIPF